MLMKGRRLMAVRKLMGFGSRFGVRSDSVEKGAKGVLRGREWLVWVC